ncbi:hypothetical protein BsWGS_02525 [Bradybaena similaris]
MTVSEKQLYVVWVYVALFYCIHISCSFLLDDPKVNCPAPATNCLNDTYNRVFQSLGCLGCQTGCQPGYIMTANPRYFVTGNDTAGSYTYQGVTIPRSKNVSEPQWLCLAGTVCPFGYFLTKIGSTDSCAYCGEGCMTCQSYDNCNDCLLGYWLAHTTGISVSATTCANSGVLCPQPRDGWHCKHPVYARSVVGCSGCVICEEGYLPTSNPNYKRTPDKVTSTYSFMGLQISGSVEITEGRYTCVKGSTCSSGWVNVTRNGLILCEVDASVVG